MANKETKLKFKVGIEGVDKLRGLTSSLKKLNDNSTLVDKSGKKLLVNLQKKIYLNLLSCQCLQV